ncbi:MAG: GGDEF domain-containing protein [Sulfuritalea sp.]|nr:GGDEF domain-containing protein [Sulfuritalea sp.]
MLTEIVDPRTFLLVANLLGMFCALVLWVQARSFPDDINGLGDWALAVVLIGSASGLASMRGIFADVFSIVVASTALLLGQYLLIVGLQRYAGQEPRWRPALDGIGAVVILIVWLTYGSHSYQGRIFIMSLAHMGLFSIGAVLAWRAKPTGIGSRFLTAFFVLGVLVAVWRLTTLTVAVDQSDEIFDRNLIQQVYLGMFSLGVLGLSVGFILLTNERLRAELEFMATRDPMTGALNRRAFFAQAEVEWARSMRARRPLATIASDIDFFKKVNDTYGHHVGDLVIKDFTSRAAQMLRLPDVLARFGGEEFVILLPDTGLAEARKVAERIRGEIEIHRNKELPAYTVSIGLSVAQGEAGQAADIEALIAEADAALYRAKQGGRNRVEA